MSIQFLRRSSFIFFAVSLFTHALIFGAAVLLPQMLQNKNVKFLPLGPITTLNISFHPSHQLGAFQKKQTKGCQKSIPTKINTQGHLLAHVRKTKNIESSTATYHKTSHSQEKAIHIPLSHLNASSFNQQPQYPEEAENQGIEAKCLVKIIIDPSGSIAHIQSLASPNECPSPFVRELHHTLKHWKFHNPQSNNVETIVPIDFKLSDYH